MTRTVIFTILLFALGSGSVRGCASVEEGTVTAVRCTTPVTNEFTSLGVQVKAPSGASRAVSVCYKNGSCSDNEPRSYQAMFSVRTTSTGVSNYTLTLQVASVSREDKRVQCMVGGIVSDQCTMDVYVVPEKPVCEPPKFIEKGATMSLRCTADKVYPNALCNFTVQHNVQVEQVQVTHRASSRYPGDKEVMCELRVPVRDNSAGDYHFQAGVQVDVPNHPTDFVHGDDILLQLSEVALVSHHSNDVFEIEKGNDLKRMITITGNPPPNQFSVTVIPSEGFTLVTLLHSDYVTSYSSGILQLELRDVGRSGPGFGAYTLRAGNGLGGAWPQLEYKFVIQDKSGDSGDLAVPIGVAVYLALLLLLLFIGCFTGKASERSRNSNFDTPYKGAAYIYPNMGYDPNNDDCNQRGNPPPYAPAYVDLNEYVDLGAMSKTQTAPEGKMAKH